MRFATVGMEFVMTIALLTGGGLLLDRWLGTRAAFTMLGAFCGFAAATYRLVRQARSIGRSSENRGDDRDRGP